MAVVPRSIGYGDTIPDLYSVLNAGPLADTSSKNDDLEKLLGKPDPLADRLAQMAVTFAEYGKSGPRPTSLLGALGAALGGSQITGNKASKDYLEQLVTAQKLRQLRKQFELQQKWAPIFEQEYQKQLGGGAAGPTPTGPSTAPPGTPAAPAASPAAAPGGPAAATLPLTTPRPGSPGETIGGPVTPPPNRAAGGGVPDDLPPDAGTDPSMYAGLLSGGSGQNPLVQYLASLQGGPSAGSTPGSFRDDARYASMVDAASDRFGGSGSTDPLSLIEKYESGGRNVKQGVVPESVSSASGYWQMIDPTWKRAAAMAGIDTSAYPHAMDAPREVQRAAAEALYNKEGYAPWAPYNPRLAAAVGYRGGAPLAAGGGGNVTGGVADLVASAAPGPSPALRGLLATMGASGSSRDPLSGLLDAMGAGGGDDGGSLPGDLVSGLSKPAAASAATDLRAAPVEAPVEAPAERPTGGARLAAYATGNARPGGPSSVDGLNPGFAGAIERMVADMPPDIRARFQIISGHRDAQRQMEVNPSAPNSRHIPGLAADLGNDPAVLSWIRENGSKYDVGFPLLGMKGEQNHLEYLPGGLRTGGAATKLPRTVTEGVADLPDVRTGLLGEDGSAGGVIPPALRGLLSIMDQKIDFPESKQEGSSTLPPELRDRLSSIDDSMKGMTADWAGGGDTGGYSFGLPKPSGAVPGMTPGAAEPRPFSTPAGAPAASGAPTAAPGAPPAAPGGGPPIPPLPNVSTTEDNTPRRLALLDAMAKMAGMDMPFKELMEVYYRDPQYLMRAAGAKAAGELPYQVQLAAIKAGYDLSNNKEIERLKNDLAMLKDGIITEGGVQKLAPGRLELEKQRQAQEADIKERAKALQESTEIYVPTRDPFTGAMTQNKFSVTREEAGNYAQGKGIPRLGIPATGGGGAPGSSGATGAGPMGGAPSNLPGADDMAKEAVKSFATAQQAEDAASKHTAALGQMAQAMEGFKPGATAELRQRGLSLLRDLGFIQGSEVPSMETFQKAASYLQVASAPRGQGAVSNYERELFGQAVPRMVDTEEGLARAITIARRLDDYDRQVAQIWRESAGKTGVPNYLEARQRIAALGPPLTPGETAALQRLKDGKVAGAEANASGIPPGATPAGTYQGKPVYKMPDGSMKVMQ